MCGGDWKGIVHYELLQSGETINSVLYCAQLDRSNEAIQKECPELAHRKGVVSHHDNALPHIFDDSEQIDGTWMGSFDPSTC